MILLSLYDLGGGRGIRQLRVPEGYGNGEVGALTDGLLLIRYLFDFRGESLISNAVDANATRKTAADIVAYIEARVPGS